MKNTTLVLKMSEPMNKDEMVKEIKRMFNKTGWTQIKLGRMSGVSKNHATLFFNGRNVPFSEIEKMYNFLKVFWGEYGTT